MNKTLKKIFKELLSFAVTVAETVIVVLLIVNFLARPVQVQGSSMYPFLEDGEIGICNVLGVKLNHIERFDVVIVYESQKNDYLVKRVIGLPGETLRYINGKLYINDELVDETFLDNEYVKSYSGSFMSDIQEIKLAEDEYYLLGDNRPHSNDSRYYGPFKKDKIFAKGVIVLYPFEKLGVKTW